MRTKHHLGLLTATFSLSLLPLGLPLTVKAEINNSQIIAQSNSGSVICESSGNRTKKCPINTRNGVILLEQLSNATCDGNWDYGDGYVEVRNGCRAKFAPEERRHGNNNNNNSNNVTCESSRNRSQRCSMNTRNGVILVRQLSNASCDGNWDYGDGYVEVRNGCRGEFARDNNNGNNNNNSNNVTCGSSRNRSQRCSMNTRNGVILVRQLSNASCDGNWDYGDGYVEVRNGCRGEFARDNNNRNNNNNSSNNSSNNRMLKARAAYDTILVDQDANFVIGVAQGARIYINCNDITRIEGNKRVFAMDDAGNKGYILVNAVDGATCNW